MVKIIKYNEKSFNSNLDRRINSKRLQSNKIELSVKKILNDIKRNKNKALFKYVQKFDNIKNPNKDLKVKSSEIKKAKNLCTSDSIKALKLAANRIEKFHKNQMPKNVIYKDKEGMSIKYKISRERIRQIENKAFEKLQKHMLLMAKSKNLLPVN